MKNLAGDFGCDEVITVELIAADIKIVKHPLPLKAEVPASITGQLLYNGRMAFTFHRAWYYWVALGNVPLAVAEEMYAHPVGLRDVRVAGYAGNADPKEWAFPEDGVVRDYLEAHHLPDVNYGDLAKLCNSGEIAEPRFVRTYHIDSLEGLILFVKTLQKHGLINDLQFEVVK